MAISAIQRKQLTTVVIMFLYNTKYKRLPQLNLDAGNALREVLFPQSYQQSLTDMAVVVNKHSAAMSDLYGKPLNCVTLTTKNSINIANGDIITTNSTIMPFAVNMLQCEPFVDVLDISTVPTPHIVYNEVQPVVQYITHCRQFVNECEQWYQFFENNRNLSMSVLRSKYPSFHRALERCKSLDYEGASNCLSSNFLHYVQNTIADYDYRQAG